MLTGTDIDYNRPYDKSLNAYPIYIEVNNGTDLTRLAPTFELTEGASIEPANGSTQNFTNPVRYTVTSEDKNWHRTYAINIHYPETKSIPTVFNFENVKTVPYNKNEYYVLYEAASGYSTLTWSSGNQGFALTGSGYTPNDFPTSISPNGRTGNCLQLITRKTGSLGTLVGMPIAAGNLFIGSFDIGSAMSDACRQPNSEQPSIMNPLNWSATTNTKQDQNSMRTENIPTEKTFSISMPCFTKRPKTCRCWMAISQRTIMNMKTW